MNRRSKPELVERRERVWQLRLRGMQPMAIATMENISMSTLWRDVRRMAEANKQRLTHFDVVGELSEAIRFYELIREEALSEFTLTTSQKGSMGAIKTGLLKVAMEAQNAITKVLQDSGFLDHRIGELYVRTDEEPELQDIGSLRERLEEARVRTDDLLKTARVQ